MTDSPRRALVVGASSGIGAACLEELARRGWTVAGTARRLDQLEAVCRKADPEGTGRARPYANDVRDLDAIPALFDRILQDLGGLDMIVYAAGVMPRVGGETYDTDLDRQMLEVNLLGCMAWLNPAARHFRKQGSGRIVGISSIAGDRGRRMNPGYHTSKAGMDTYLESLRNRLTQHGTRVTTIKPGYVDTDMTRGLKGLFWVISPEQAARTIVTAAEKGKRKRYVPWRWTVVGLVIRSIPSFLFTKLEI